MLIATQTTSPTLTSLDLPVGGMDCADCAAHIERAVRALPGVHDVQVLVAAERATVREVAAAEPLEAGRRDVGQIIGWGALGMVAVVVIVAALGEQLGVFDAPPFLTICLLGRKNMIAGALRTDWRRGCWLARAPMWRFGRSFGR